MIVPSNDQFAGGVVVSKQVCCMNQFSCQAEERCSVGHTAIKIALMRNANARGCINICYLADEFSKVDAQCAHFSQNSILLIMRGGVADRQRVEVGGCAFAYTERHRATKGLCAILRQHKHAIDEKGHLIAIGQRLKICPL